MSDIVERLRNYIHGENYAEVPLRIKEAADEIERLRKIEIAAQKWRASLEDDGLSKVAIESGICRPGIAELFRLIDATTAHGAKG